MFLTVRKDETKVLETWLESGNEKRVNLSRTRHASDRLHVNPKNALALAVVTLATSSAGTPKHSATA